jgi:hypothetical protein
VDSARDMRAHAKGDDYRPSPPPSSPS